MSKHTLPRERGSGLPRGARALALGTAAGLAGSLALVLAATPASAVDTAFFVSPSGSGNACSSASPCAFVGRALTAAANRPAGENITINVAPGVYTESATSTDGLLISLANSPASLTIRGTAANQVTIRPGTDRRVARLTGSFPVRFERLTLTGGNLAAASVGMAGAAGGGILVTGSGPLTIAQSVVTSNRAGAGGRGGDGANGASGSSSGTVAAANGGNAPLAPPNGPTVGGAGGLGGGIAVTGSADLTIIESTISANTAGTGGIGGLGGRGGDGARNTVTPATGAGGNGAPGAVGGAGGAAGGIAFAGGTLTITTTTNANNTAGTGGVGGEGGRGGAGADGNIVVKPAGNGGNGAAGGVAGAAGDFGGISITGGRATLTHTTVVGNSGGLAGAPGMGGAAGAAGIPFPGNLVDPVPAPPPAPMAGMAGPAGAAGAASTVNGVRLAATAISAELRASLLANQAGARANCAGALTSSTTTASDASCAGATNNPAVATNLTVLTDNGGTTTTIGFTGVNPAINSVPIASCLASDQRVLPRPGFTGLVTCTAGAFEPQMPGNPSNPTITAVETSAVAKSAFGFYRADVRVTFTCTPGSTPGSGTIVRCPAAVTFTANGLGQG
ncbi:MAG: choice-of-anchor Q domain-containing protein, partial [Sporichthyaceae bacterium]